MAFPKADDFLNHQARWNGFIQILLKIIIQAPRFEGMYG